MAKNRQYSLEVKQRFIKAIETISREHYPDKREVDIIKSLGFAPPNYYRMRTSTNNYPTLDDCHLLCKLYGVSEAWLLSNKEPFRVEQIQQTSPIDLLKKAVELLEKQSKK